MLVKITHVMNTYKHILSRLGRNECKIPRVDKSRQHHQKSIFRKYPGLYCTILLFQTNFPNSARKE